MTVYPAPGLTIRDPDLFDFLPASGRDVPDTDYWIRRLRDGDVTTTPSTASSQEATE